MKKAFKLLVVAVFVAVAFNSCKKDGSPTGSSSYTMKLTVNGSDVSFNTASAADITAGSIDQVAFLGNNINGTTVGDSEFEIDIIESISAIKAGQTYPISTSFAQKDAATLTYYPNQNDIFTSQPAKPIGTVSITEVTSTYIKGTFSGKLFAQSDFAGATVKYTITNGTFTAKKPK